MSDADKSSQVCNTGRPSQQGRGVFASARRARRYGLAAPVGVVITVTVVDTGDNAEVDTPEAALSAALTLGREAREAAGVWGFDPHIRFDVDGEPVRVATLRSLTR